MQRRLVYYIKFILAFCSMVYELVLAQALTAFLDNTVLRYSVTIGLYLCAMGLGALAAEQKFLKRPFLTLLRVELLLALVGGFAVVFLYALDFLHGPRLLFGIVAHGLIVFIGLLAGFEVPLCIELMGQRQPNKEHLVLAVDYLGALFGTIVFAFVFYPRLGLLAAAFLTGILNCLAGISLVLVRKEFSAAERPGANFLFILSALLAVLLTVCLSQSVALGNYFINRYVS